MDILASSFKTTVYLSWFLHSEKVWEENFTLVNMEMFGRRNVRKHREIKNGEQYIPLDIYLKSGNLDKMRITTLEANNIWEEPVMGLSSL